MKSEKIDIICKICGNGMEFLEEVEGCAEGHAGLGNSAFRMPTCKMNIFKCENCSHVQSGNDIPKEYYNDYDLYEENDKIYYGTFSSVCESRLANLRNMAMNDNGLLDIGCGRGDVLESAQSLFNNCIGVESSAQECKKAQNRGLDVIQSYFDKTLKMKEEFSAFISTMVFEHLNNPLETLKCAYDALEWNGVGLINIPNGKMIIQNNLYHQIISEHINYYSPLSITMMANKAGFDVVRIDENYDLIELDVYLRKPIKKDRISLTKCLQKKSLTNLLTGSSNIVIWGAGIKAHSYSELLGDIKISHIMDASKDKIGRYISGISLPIEEVSKEIINLSDAIIIFATLYNNEIIENLINVHKYAGKIIYFCNNEVKCVQL